MKATKVRDRKTGEIYFAEYGHNSKGNLRYWVCGKFYSDKLFDKTFEILRIAIEV
jgi:hypothetical protein